MFAWQFAEDAGHRGTPRMDEQFGDDDQNHYNLVYREENGDDPRLHLTRIE